jgi:hypothetical protein
VGLLSWLVGNEGVPKRTGQAKWPSSQGGRREATRATRWSATNRPKSRGRRKLFGVALSFALARRLWIAIVSSLSRSAGPASVAQLAEPRFCKPEVVGSSPTASFANTKLQNPNPKRVSSFLGFGFWILNRPVGFLSGQKGQTVNLVAMPSQVRILLPPLAKTQAPKEKTKTKSQGEGAVRLALEFGFWPLDFTACGCHCGCSSMVELQPSKLVVRVRFPSPA